jgi:hypothetical protein
VLIEGGGYLAKPLLEYLLSVCLGPTRRMDASLHKWQNDERRLIAGRPRSISHLEGSGCFPHLIENAGRQCRLVLRQEAPVVLLNHIRRILNGVARLFIGPGLL